MDRIGETKKPKKKRRRVRFNLPDSPATVAGTELASPGSQGRDAAAHVAKGKEISVQVVVGEAVTGNVAQGEAVMAEMHKGEVGNNKVINDKVINDEVVSHKLVSDKGEVGNDKVINDKVINDEVVSNKLFSDKVTRGDIATTAEQNVETAKSKKRGTVRFKKAVSPAPPLPRYGVDTSDEDEGPSGGEFSVKKNSAVPLNEPAQEWGHYFTVVGPAAEEISIPGLETTTQNEQNTQEFGEYFTVVGPSASESLPSALDGTFDDQVLVQSSRSQTTYTEGPTKDDGEVVAAASDKGKSPERILDDALQPVPPMRSTAQKVDDDVTAASKKATSDEQITEQLTAQSQPKSSSARALEEHGAVTSGKTKFSSDELFEDAREQAPPKRRHSRSTSTSSAKNDGIGKSSAQQKTQLVSDGHGDKAKTPMRPLPLEDIPRLSPLKRRHTRSASTASIRQSAEIAYESRRKTRAASEGHDSKTTTLKRPLSLEDIPELSPPKRRHTRIIFTASTGKGANLGFKSGEASSRQKTRAVSEVYDNKTTTLERPPSLQNIPRQSPPSDGHIRSASTASQGDSITVAQGRGESSARQKTPVPVSDGNTTKSKSRKRPLPLDDAPEQSPPKRQHKEAPFAAKKGQSSKAKDKDESVEFSAGPNTQPASEGPVEASGLHLTDWSREKVPELRKELSKRHLLRTGVKADLVQRLTEWEIAENHALDKAAPVGASTTTKAAKATGAIGKGSKARSTQAKKAAPTKKKAAALLPPPTPPPAVQDDAGTGIQPQNDGDVIDGVIRCVCKRSLDDGFTVECEKCETWQHMACYYPGQTLDDEYHHVCNDCKNWHGAAKPEATPPASSSAAVGPDDEAADANMSLMSVAAPQPDWDAVEDYAGSPPRLTGTGTAWK